jgi:hypothetical protein
MWNGFFENKRNRRETWPRENESSVNAKYYAKREEY